MSRCRYCNGALNTCRSCTSCGRDNNRVFHFCADCRKPIEDNDDAGVCIECGGRNRRKEDE